MEIIAYSDKRKDETIQFVISILEGEFGYTGFERPDLYNIEKTYQQDKKSNFWLAILDDKVIGTIAVKDYGNNRGFIKRLYVDKRMRSKGIGQRLMKTLLEFARDSGFEVLYTSTVEEFMSARNFYEKNGFIEIGRLPKDISNPGDNIFLELKL